MTKRNFMKRCTVAVTVLAIFATGIFWSGGQKDPITQSAEALSTGNIVNVTYEGHLKGVENKHYTAASNGSVLFYNADGSTYTEVHTEHPTYRREYIILTDVNTGEQDRGYCIEYAAEVKKGNSYAANQYLQDTTYFNNLPEDVKKLMLASIYFGRNGINPVPVSGANDEDFYFATQMMIWEVQQQLRVFERDSEGRVTGTKRVDAHGMPNYQFYNLLKGRAAEKCYNYLVSKFNEHFVVPDFIGETAAQAKPITMKYRMETRDWKATVSDSRNSSFKMVWGSKDISHTQSGSSHSFSTDKAVADGTTLKVKRTTAGGSAAENLLIWHNQVDASHQVMSTGSASPPEFYIKLKTDIPAEVTVEKKDTETGKPVLLVGTQYKIKSVELNKYVSEGMKNDEGDIYVTNRDGQIVVGEKFQAGDFLLEEVKAPKGYVVETQPQEFHVDGKTAQITVSQSDMPQKGIITIKKIGEYRHHDKWEDIREKVMGGIDFDVIALADIITPDGTLRAKKGEVVDTVRTDFNGNVSTKELYLGPYNIVEKDAPVEYRISEAINVALVYEGQDIAVTEKKINILNRLKRDTDAFGSTPKTGDDTGVNTAIITLLLSLTLIAVSSVFFALKRED
ncbi:MAG: SpaA isopeptide-forming pilin-related protein [Bacillota bacterium]|nr:SpaA isopeptide-forming pilin-related protein [Bacillota bacterium]